MRRQGTRFECFRLRPHDHLGWVFAGTADYAALATPFLAEGAALGERLMYVAEDPAAETTAELARIAGPHGLQVASIAEVYGPSGIVDAASQRATFAAALAEALAEGCSGIRVAADNTPLVTDEERLAAWIRWEIAADRFMAENPVTGLCAFDREKVNVDRLRHLATLHPLSSVTSPVPQFRLFADSGNLLIEGEIDSFAVSQLRLALDVLPRGTGVLVDLAAATLTSRVVLASLQRLSEEGAAVTIRGDPALVGEPQRPGPLARGRLVLPEAPGQLRRGQAAAYRASSGRRRSQPRRTRCPRREGPHPAARDTGIKRRVPVQGQGRGGPGGDRLGQRELAAPGA